MAPEPTQLRVVLVAQLVEQLPPTAEVNDLIPINTSFYHTYGRKGFYHAEKIKMKEARNDPFKKNAIVARAQSCATSHLMTSDNRTLREKI